eukprot:5906016-Pyramimonas_sp.AAC.1
MASTRLFLFRSGLSLAQYTPRDCRKKAKCSNVGSARLCEPLLLKGSRAGRMNKDGAQERRGKEG